MAFPSPLSPGVCDTQHTDFLRRSSTTFPVLYDQLLSLVALLGKVIETNSAGRCSGARTGRHLVIIRAR